MQNFSLRYSCEIFYLICINSLKALRQDPPSQSDIYWLAGWTWLLRQFKISAWVRFRCRGCISPRNSRASNWVPRPENWKCISPEKLWAIFIHPQFRHIFHDFEHRIARFCLGRKGNGNSPSLQSRSHRGKSSTCGFYAERPAAQSRLFYDLYILWIM